MDVSSFIENTGKSDEVKVFYEKDVLSYGGNDYPVKEKADFNFSLKNTDGRELFIKGSGKVLLVFPCDRCLKDVDFTFPVEIDRSFLLSDKKIVPDEEGESLKFFNEEELDTDSLIEDEIFLNWPVKVLCKEDCKGLCKKCGADLNIKDCGCEDFVMDPRMAQFEDLFKEFKEVE